MLAQTRDELLPLLMSGKVRVRDAERRVERGAADRTRTTPLATAAVGHSLTVAEMWQSVAAVTRRWTDGDDAR